MPKTPRHLDRLDVAVTIRLAHVGDDRAIARLAALDSTAAPQHPLLLAEVAGAPLAALSLTDGRAIADPFSPTADLVTLLHERARTAASRPGARRAAHVSRALRAGALHHP